jgi:lipopolysaccharide/colanic/teichoic acid biosynthesis glycosyltransferase
MDFIVAFFLIVLFFPLFILVSLCIYLAMGLPILYKQERVGARNKTFVIYKFRSMLNKSEKFQTEEERIQWFGKILRQFRIDELPQLFNILLGHMSFIGPRPLLTEYLPYYNEFEIRRHEVRPGLSGYSQVRNLNNMDWEEQFRLDIYYVNNLSFKLDSIILVKTILKVLRASKMIKTGYKGRIRFDTYRKQQMEQ